MTASLATCAAMIRAGGLIVAATGLAMIVGVTPLGAPALTFLLDLVFLPLDGAPAAFGPDAGLLAAIAGGLMVGWGWTVYLVGARVFPRDPALARALLLPGILAWFVADGIGSVLAGAWFNAVLNVGFLALLAAPLLPRRKAAAA
ncbi:MAG: hypothetical protein RIB45_05685 [Marivibrio sp.]|uniref:hypothetical protein n=1 Tax=Marivibrio sp. TaxID=2039719 RepID=UPI0032EB8C3C